MRSKNSRVQIFSIRRILISCVLGFLIPFSYALGLSLVSDYTGRSVPDSMVYPFGWPGSLWVFLLKRQPMESDFNLEIALLAICNIALYGTLSYLALFALQVLRHKPASPELPPAPHLSSEV